MRHTPAFARLSQAYQISYLDSNALRTLTLYFSNPFSCVSLKYLSFVMSLIMLGVRRVRRSRYSDVCSLLLVTFRK